MSNIRGAGSKNLTSQFNFRRVSVETTLAVDYKGGRDAMTGRCAPPDYRRQGHAALHPRGVGVVSSLQSWKVRARDDSDPMPYSGAGDRACTLARQRSRRDEQADDDRIDWLRTLPFAGLHLACIAVIWVESAHSPWVWPSRCTRCACSPSGFLSSLFSHRAFRASRAVQFTSRSSATSVQRPLWWAAHHRNHHRYADGDRDPHSPHAWDSFAAIWAGF